MSTSLAVINTKAPFSTSDGKDALDLALIFGSYEQEVGLFFIGDGVWQLVSNTDGSLLNIKDYLKTLDALGFYDIEQLFVCKQSIDARSINAMKEIEGITLLEPTELKTQLANYKHVLRF